MAFTVPPWERASEIFETASAAFARAELDGSVTGVVPTVLLGSDPPSVDNLTTPRAEVLHP